ncbi:S41 family peptidase [Aureivirga sp. CE67]|uniref:S41 family peptidase n=1 Tax=Aureivirga sp. CE67 TaxID=1788983 RepID=UPI0018C99308|nr:S41 family peptidase [Aureivirga sp. CE67]
MKNKINLPLFIGLGIAFGILIGSTFNYKNNAIVFSASTTGSEEKIKRLIDYIQYEYVDEVDTDSLLDEAIENMLEKLDPHSVYIPKENLEQVTERMQGNFVGVGIQFRMYKDTLMVVRTIEDGPSEKAGILAGDRFLMANKDTLFGRQFSSLDVMKSLKGIPDSEIDLLVYRKSTGEKLNIPVTRGKVSIKSIPVAYMLNDTTGYIKMERFANTTYDEFKNALDDLKSKGMNTMVLDLRDNSGGYLHIANQIIDEFLEKGKLIVYTKNKKGAINKSFAKKKGAFEDGNLYVLINENSASASEIVAGALQDNDKGTIVGRRSFGKGLVQQEMNLGDGSAVRLTTSRYYTPTGRSIQRPYGEKTETYYEDYLKRVESGELLSADSIKTVDSLRFTTPKGKVVYGGGGIVPDVFVPIDTTTSVHGVFVSDLNNFVFEYVDNNRADLSKWDVDTFVKEFDRDNKILNQYLKKFSLEKNISTQEKKVIHRYLKALIAQNLFDDIGYYKVQEDSDKMIDKVLELQKEKNDE